MKIVIDDRPDDMTTIRIILGKKTLLEKRGKSIKAVLGYVYNNTTKQKVKDSIEELITLHKYMVGIKTITRIK